MILLFEYNADGIEHAFFGADLYAIYQNFVAADHHEGQFSDYTEFKQYITEACMDGDSANEFRVIQMSETLSFSLNPNQVWHVPMGYNYQGTEPLIKA